MKLDTILVDRKGTTITGPDAESVTIRQVLLTAIDSSFEGDEKMDTATKLKLAKLGIKLETAESLTAAETTIALERAAKAFGPLVYGQVVKELDPGQL